MVRFNKEKGKTGVYNIDVKDDTIEQAPPPPTPKEPIVTQASNVELEKFAALVLKVLGDENIPPTPTNFQIYFDKLLESKPAAFKKRINDFLELEITNNDENHARIEREVKEGFTQIKNIMQVVSTVYRNLNVMQEIIKKRSTQLETNSNPLSIQNIISSLSEDLNKMFGLTTKQIDLLKEYYQDKGLEVTVITSDYSHRLKEKYQKHISDETAYEQINEFIEKFDEAINNNKKSAREYFDEVLSDYITRQVTRVETKSGQFLTYLSTSYKYFGYFNCMIERKSKDETVIILHKNNDLKQPILAKELEIITNRIVRVFNDMGATFTLFDEAVEIPLLKADNWNRFLTLNDADVCLTKFKDTPMLCLWIKLKQPILQNKN